MTLWTRVSDMLAARLTAEEIMIAMPNVRQSFVDRVAASRAAVVDEDGFFTGRGKRDIHH